jgi:hypothetical protein
MEENSLGDLDTKILEKVGVKQRQEHHFFESVHVSARNSIVNIDEAEAIQTHPSRPATVEKSILGSTNTGHMSALSALSRSAPPRCGPRLD